MSDRDMALFGMTPDGGCLECATKDKRIAELEARLEFKQKNTDALIARWEPYIKQLEEENQWLKEQLAESEQELTALLESEGLLERTDE